MYQPLFIFIQETWLPSHETHVISDDFQDYCFLTTSADMFEHEEDTALKQGPVWHGTALGWKKSIDQNITKLPIICERFCSVKYVTSQSKASVLLYSTYLPTSGQDDDFLETLATLDADINQHKDENTVVILGSDTNVSSKSTKRRYKAMQIFLHSHLFKSILKTQEPTFHHNNQSSESQIDHIYYSIPNKSKTIIELNKHLCQKENSSNLSAHDVLVGMIGLPATIDADSDEADFTSTYTPFVVKKLKWNESGRDTYQKQTSHILQDLLNKYSAPEFIPVLCEMFSRALVISAENNFEDKCPLKTHTQKHKAHPYFSKEYRDAHKAHKNNFEEWRKSGRPSDRDHPAKEKVLQSRRRLQRIARDESSAKSIEFSNDLMETFRGDINKVYSKLKKYRGEAFKRIEIPFIETLDGKFTGKNILEGFARNTEILCTEDDQKNENYDNDMYDMFEKDNMVTFDITSKEAMKIPHMNLTDLKHILFKKLQVNKACDVFKLTIEHLRYAGDQTLLIILELLNHIIDNINVMSSPQLNTSIASVEE